MLIIARKAGELIEFTLGGQRVTVKVHEIDQGYGRKRRVRLAIDAPPAVHILRSELAPLGNVAAGTLPVSPSPSLLVPNAGQTRGLGDEVTRKEPTPCS